MNNIEAHTTTIKPGDLVVADNKRYLVVEVCPDGRYKAERISTALEHVDLSDGKIVAHATTGTRDFLRGCDR